MEKITLPPQTKAAALAWIKEGKPCIYRHGWAYRGAYARRLTQEQALELLPKYDFGMGFYEIDFHEQSYTDKEHGLLYDAVLEFNELGENDLY